MPGQNIRYSFTGAASQQVSWHYSNNTIGTGTMVILLPNGSTLTGYLSYGGTTSGTLSATLPVAGTYTGVVFVDRAATGHIDLQLQSP